MTTTYTIPFILVRLSYASGKVKYLAKTVGFCSHHWENSDDAIKQLCIMLELRAHNQSLEALKRMHVTNPEWINDTLQDLARFNSIKGAELLPLKTFTITR
jgi:hypothetical protein